MNLKTVDLVPENSTVIIRLDLDLPVIDGNIVDNHRLLKSLSTINKLLTHNCQLIIIGHMGRPTTAGDEKYSLRGVYLELMSLLSNNYQSLFLENLDDISVIDLALSQNQIVFVENLRFWPSESEGDMSFLQPLIDQSQAFVNDAIAVAHRPSASVLLHQYLPAFYGDNFIEEINNLQKILTSHHPKTLIIGGAKADKIDYLSELANIFDNICIGGKLPQFPEKLVYAPNVFVSTLTPDTFDIDQNSIDHIKNIINNSQTIVWSGAMGFFENPSSKQGTIEIANSLAQSMASYKVIAGGDTLSSIKELNLLDKIDFVSSGGGVLLEFLAKGKLPAW
ncbi:MAG: phosphoglycerate kinase [Candidatus Shapirobacteria bacterium]